MRRALFITLVLLLIGLGAIVGWLLTSEPAMRWVVAQAQSRAAGELTLGGVTGRLLGPIEIDNLAYRTETSRLHIKRVTLDWRPWALLYGRLHVTEAHVVGVAIDLAESPKQPRKPFQLPITVRIDRGTLQGMALRRGASVPITIDSAEIALAADENDLSVDQLRVTAPHFSLTASGALDSKDGIRIDWHTGFPTLPRIAGQGAITGTLRQLHTQQQVTAPIAVTVNADLDLTKADPRFALHATFPATALNQIASSWPDVEVSGDVEVRGTPDDFIAATQLHLAYQTERLQIDAQAQRRQNVVTLTMFEARRPDSTGRLHAKGHYTFSDSPAAFALALDWREWQWPGLTAVPMTSNGKAHIDGTLAAYRMQAQASFTSAALPPAHLNISLHGNAKTVVLDTLRLNTLAGFVTAQGTLEPDPWRWQLRVRGENLNPGAHWAAWPGQLAFNARARGGIDRGRLRNEVALSGLSGTVRGHSVSASARWSLAGTRHDIAQAVLRVGSAEIRAHGKLARDWDLTLHANAPNLATLAPDASGSAQAHARATGPRTTPRWEASLTAARVRYQTTEIENLSAAVRLDLANREPSSVDVTARAVRYRQRLIERIELTGRGAMNDHRLALRMAAPETTLATELRGAYAARAWHGRIVAASVSAAYGTWSLQAPAPLRVTGDGFAAGPFCLHADGGSRACADIAWSTTAPGRANVHATTLPLAWFHPLLPASLRLRGALETTIAARFDAKQPVEANAEFKLVGASIARTEGSEALDIERGGGRLTLNADGLRANVNVALGANDALDADITLPRFRPGAPAGAEQPLTGRVRARLSRLARIGMFLPDVEKPDGRLDVDYHIAGTVTEPTLRGNATLTDASANIPALGIRVRKVSLRVRADGGRVLRLDGSAASGPGEANLSGDFTLDGASAWHANLRLDGKRLEVANLSQAWALASPTLEVVARPGWLRVQGSVEIPEAKLTPKKPQMPTSPSEDVVIVNAADEPVEAHRRWAVETQIRIVLGDKVAFDGFGLTGNITGGLVAVDSPERVTTGRGELRIEKGKYEAYGRKLEVVRGRLLFAGGPVDNPGIDARAVRRVDEITAGIAIGGTLRSPELSLFSEPPLSESDTLSYLLFGRPLESTSGAQGRMLANAATALKLAGGERLAESLAARFGIEEVGIESGATSEDAALVLGKYLSPRLYINYSIGLFEQVNVLRLRYQLTSQWALQVESGTYTGADLLYTIER